MAEEFMVKIPDGFDAEERQEIAKAIVAFIQNRTAVAQIGYDPDTKRNYSLSSVPYTEDYADKKGVSESDVDLTLSSAMLKAIRPISVKKNEIVVGITNSKQAAKSEGNQIGSYGREPNPDKARPYLGIAPVDLKRILAEYE